MSDAIPPVAYAISDTLRRKRPIQPEMLVELLTGVMAKHDRAFSRLDSLRSVEDLAVLEEMLDALKPIRVALFGASPPRQGP